MQEQLSENAGVPSTTIGVCARYTLTKPFMQWMTSLKLSPSYKP